MDWKLVQMKPIEVEVIRFADKAGHTWFDCYETSLLTSVDGFRVSKNTDTYDSWELEYAQQQSVNS